MGEIVGSFSDVVCARVCARTRLFVCVCVRVCLPVCRLSRFCNGVMNLDGERAVVRRLSRLHPFHVVPGPPLIAQGSLSPVEGEGIVEEVSPKEFVHGSRRLSAHTHTWMLMVAEVAIRVHA